MTKAVIVDAIRTPVGKRGGQLCDIHAVDLASLTLEGLVERNGLDPALVEDVIFGCVTQSGEQSFNIARNAALAAKAITEFCRRASPSCRLNSLPLPSHSSGPVHDCW